MSDNINNRDVLMKIQDEMGHDDFQRLSYLSKDFISAKKRDRIKTAIELFSALEETGTITCTDKNVNFEFLRKSFDYMDRKDIVRLLKNETQANQLCNATHSKKRITLFQIGEETGSEELKELKAYLRNKHNVSKRELGKIGDVWNALDILERKTDQSPDWVRDMLPIYNEGDIRNKLESFLANDQCGTSRQVNTEQNEIAESGAIGYIQSRDVQTVEISHPQDETVEISGSYSSPTDVQRTEYADGGSTMTFTINTAGPETTTGCQQATQDHFEKYDMASPAGMCIIFNNEVFGNAGTHPARHGTNFDKDKLKDCFKRLGFIVSVYENQSSSAMQDILTEVRSSDHTAYSALVVCILSHGNLNVVSGSDCTNVSISSLTSLFRADECPSLSGKPKFFIIQACQGSETQRVWYAGAESTSATCDVNPVPNCEVSTENRIGSRDLVAAEADFLIALSTMPGFVSFRTEHGGSFFIQSLTKNLIENSPRQDVLSILVKVNNEVSRKIGITPRGRMGLQIPEPKVRLTKKLFLYPDTHA